MTEYLEKLALTCSYNQLGGILFDKRLRSLVTFLSGITQWSVSVLDFAILAKLEIIYQEF